MLQPDALPSLRGLATFETAARTKSFTLAAEALGISQPAVSHAVRQLEDDLGVVLFDRRRKGVTLTSAGQHLYEQTSLGLALIGQAILDIQTVKPNRSVSLAVSTATATWWLLPRIARFKLAHPKVELRCITIDDDQNLDRDPVDLAIPLGSGDFPKHQRWPLFEEEVFPVCSPAYLARHGPWRDIDALTGASLLHLEERYRSRMNWASWLSRFGVSLPRDNRHFSFNDYAVILQAALEGQGIALGWRHLVEAPLANGLLVRPVPQTVVTEHPMCVIAPRHRPLRADVMALKDWLLAEARTPAVATQP
jgi:LysR family transcriptional regulator, glycine cleavage system transcriptional activator